MRFVFFADLHLDSAFVWAGSESGARRRQALRDVLKNILNLADEVEADGILCAGDLYEHDRYTSDTREFLRQTFAETHRPIYISPGNHDYFGSRSLYAQDIWPANVTIFQQPELTPIDLTDGLTLWGAAFTQPTRPNGFLSDGFRVDRDGRNIALFHGSEKLGIERESGRKNPYAPFDTQEIENAGLDHAFVGHFHQPKDDEFFTYPGNPDPLSFGETGERGAVIVEISSDGTLKRERRIVSVSEIHDLELDVTGSSSFDDVRDRAAELLSGLSGAARITVTGDVSPDIELVPGRLTDVPHTLDAAPVIRVGTLSVAYDFEDIAQELTVRGRFVQDVLEDADLDDDTKCRILVTGLRALEGREDLEVA
ncbi:MAG: exonuclease SbcCD subunit D [Rhodothermia bacterium]